MTTPLEELRNKKKKARDFEFKQTSEFMLGIYEKGKVVFVESLFDTISGACPNYKHPIGEGDFPCGLSRFYSNGANNNCSKYWVSYGNLIKGILDLCDSPSTNKSRKSAEDVFQDMWSEGFLIEKRCKRRAKGGPFAWVLEGPKSFQNWYFNTDKIGADPSYNEFEN